MFGSNIHKSGLTSGAACAMIGERVAAQHTSENPGPPAERRAKSGTVFNPPASATAGGFFAPPKPNKYRQAAAARRVHIRGSGYRTPAPGSGQIQTGCSGEEWAPHAVDRPRTVAARQQPGCPPVRRVTGTARPTRRRLSGPERGGLWQLPGAGRYAPRGELPGDVCDAAPAAMMLALSLTRDRLWSSAHQPR